MHSLTTTDISKLHGLLNWKLLRGTHLWPGPDGGTCILEAAIVAAGLPYRSVSSVDDAPADFSWVVAEFLLHLNDGLPDALRQYLIPFVTRLPGSAGSYQVEGQRLYLIITRIAKDIFPSMLEALELPDHAYKCRTMPDGPMSTYIFTQAVAFLRSTGDLPRARSKSVLAWAVEIVLWVGTRVPSERPTLLGRVLAIVDEALKVGEQVEPVDVAVAKARLEHARALPPPAVKHRLKTPA